MPFDGTWDFWVLLLITGVPPLQSPKSYHFSMCQHLEFHPHPEIEQDPLRVGVTSCSVTIIRVW